VACVLIVLSKSKISKNHKEENMSTKTVTVAETRPEVQFAKVGQPAPDFDLPSTKNLETLAENVKLSDYKGKWLILLFYPHDFTYVCPTELTAFSDRIDEIHGVGAEIIGISTDSVFSHRAWLKTPREQNGIEGLKFPLASDVGGRLAAKYNILVEDKMVALRGLFIIDPEGILRYSVIHDLNIGRSVDETLRVLQALQTGGLCGADWRPGQETLKA
jgi:peroxiredoxin (alkyl hydroperoxide reductase subunit C)